jgi:hypothetical protein
MTCRIEPPCWRHLLRAALQFSVVVRDDFLATTSDTEGNIAAGGVVRLKNYGVGARQPGTDVLAGVRASGLGGGVSLRSGRAVRRQVRHLHDDIVAASRGMTGGRFVRPQSGRLTLRGAAAYRVNAADLASVRRIDVHAPCSGDVVLHVVGHEVNLPEAGLHFYRDGVELGSNSPEAVRAGERFWLNAPDATHAALGGGARGIGGGGDTPFRANLVAPEAVVAFHNGRLAGHIYARSYWGDATNLDGAVRLVSDGYHGQIDLPR